MTQVQKLSLGKKPDVRRHMVRDAEKMLKTRRMKLLNEGDLQRL